MKSCLYEPFVVKFLVFTEKLAYGSFSSGIAGRKSTAK